MLFSIRLACIRLVDTLFPFSLVRCNGNCYGTVLIYAMNGGAVNLRINDYEGTNAIPREVLIIKDTVVTYLKLNIISE